MLNWDSFKHSIVQIETSLKKRESQWVITCTDCQNERIVTYCNAYNIVKGKQVQRCKDCGFKSGELKRNLSGLVLGRKFHPRNTIADHSKNKELYEIVHTFGVIVSSDTRQKQRLAKLGKFGPEANAWEGGKTEERRLLTLRAEYQDLRKFILNRDNYTCQICLVRGGKLEMDHIKEWCNYPELRLEKSNLRILCKKCHLKTPNFGSKAKKKAA